MISSDYLRIFIQLTADNEQRTLPENRDILYIYENMTTKEKIIKQEDNIN
jgi:hypothetical protein